MDIQALVPNVQNSLLVACAFALLANQFYVGKELHFNCHGPVALTSLAAAAWNVKGKMPRCVAAPLSFWSTGKDIPDEIEGLDVRHWIGAWSTANWGLINH